jgi:integrase
LLAVNSGAGGKDIASATVEQIRSAMRTGWLDMPRLKTGAPRRVWLWPETVAALQAFELHRKLIRRSASAETYFLTRMGKAFIRSDEPSAPDLICQQFTRLRKGVCEDRSFYDIRRTWRTVAAETLDIEAVNFIMGHSPASDDMGAIYTQRIGDDRIRRVCEHVRGWLNG